jgi:hypothetical protein
MQTGGKYLKYSLNNNDPFKLILSVRKFLIKNLRLEKSSVKGEIKKV